MLKNRWHHDGFVVSDWGAVQQLINQGIAADKREAAELALNAGLEMDMMSNAYDKHLAELVAAGKVSQKTVDDAVRRVLRLKFRLRGSVHSGDVFDLTFDDAVFAASDETESLAMTTDTLRVRNGKIVVGE